MSKVVDEFSRFANQYEQYNIIQSKVVNNLVSFISKIDYKNIVDLGCGSGAVYKNLKQQNIIYDKFIALDSSEEMLSLHGEDTKVEKICVDFNKVDTYRELNMKKEDTIFISSSALQWSEDLDMVFSNIASNSHKAYLAIFTSGTFATLHATANIDSPIYSKNELIETIDKYFNAEYKVESYRLQFESVLDMFRYIKKSGVSGGMKQLSYKQVKRLMNDYPLNYLEFEVLFVEASSPTKV